MADVNYVLNVDSQGKNIQHGSMSLKDDINWILLIFNETVEVGDIKLKIQ